MRSAETSARTPDTKLKIMGFGQWLSKNLPTIGQGSGVASTVLGMIGSIGAGKRELNRKKEMADYEQQLAMEMYNRQHADQVAMYNRQHADQLAMIQDERAYNDFGSVVARARQAGVNPVYALGGSGGVGISSSAGSVPSPSVPSASSGSMASGVYQPANSLISAGATLSAQSQQFGLYQANLDKLRAEADSARIDADWRNKQYVQDFEEREVTIELKRMNLGTEEQQKRYVTALADLQEIINNREQQLTPEIIAQAQNSTRMAVEQLAQMKVDSQYKVDFVKRELAKLDAEISKLGAEEYSLYTNAEISQYNADTARMQYGLNRQQYEEVCDFHDELVRLHDEDQELQERIRKQSDRHHKDNLTKDYILGVGSLLQRRSEIKQEVAQKQKDAITRFGSSVASAFIFKGIPL